MATSAVRSASGTAAARKRLRPPADGVTVRMYRTGHGDCFLLAFPGPSKNKVVYVLIDCGYKPGSQRSLETTAAEITANIRAATGGHIHVAIITHEHQDHLNGITAANFAGITIGEAWLAWTEEPGDAVAERLRMAFEQKLQGLLAARNRLAAEGDDSAARLDDILAFNFGDDSEELDLQAVGVPGEDGESANRRSLNLIKTLAQNNVKYIRPHQTIMTIPNVAGVRVFALGPPRDADKLEDLDPRTNEQFHKTALAVASAGNYLAAAAINGHGQSPFANRYQVDMESAFTSPDSSPFFTAHYGKQGSRPSFAHKTDRPRRKDEVPDNADWRRIDNDWLYSAEALAMNMDEYTNNTSLVLAFELGKGGKVLLFAGDAQRGNWASWASSDWQDGDTTITAKVLLGRTVLYKVGHHGSHNATLNGLAGDQHANIAWMAAGEYGREFTAMITAVREWATTKKHPWDHPLPAIKEALMRKAAGRVFQTDTNYDDMHMPDGASAADWSSFQSRATGNRLYFDYKITR